jgi:hypothetical protein
VAKYTATSTQTCPNQACGHSVTKTEGSDDSQQAAESKAWNAAYSELATHVNSAH